MPHFRRKSLLHYSLFPKELRLMFYSSLLRNLADLMVGTFAPIFLFQMGQRLPFLSHYNPFVAGMLLVCGYYFLQRLLVLVLAFPLARLMSRIGYIWSMTLGILGLCLTFVSYHLASREPRFLILALTGGALDLVLYWAAHDSVFAHEVRRNEIGRGVGALAFLTKLLQILAPAIAGWIILTTGFNTIFALGILVALCSIFPLLFLPRFAIPTRPSFQQFKVWLKRPQFRRFAVAVAGRYMDTIAILLWPVYVLIIVGNIERVGFLFSAVMFVSLVLTYVAGWYVDHSRKGHYFWMSGVILSGAWLLRLFVRGVGDIFGIELMDKLAYSFYAPCFDAYMCEVSKGSLVLQFYLYREVIFSLAAVILWGAVFGLFLLPVSWTAVFLLGSVGVLLSLFIEQRA